MVKVGFIVEGRSDFIILKSERFQKYLSHKFSIECLEDNIVISHGKSYIKEYINSYINKLKKEVDYIFIMVDQDDKEEQKKNRKYKPVDCPLIVVEEIITYRGNKNFQYDNHIFIVMTREFEAWLLADRNLGFKYTGNPESILSPSDVVAAQLGTSSHAIIAKRLKDKFSLERAAENSISAKRFLDKLIFISLQ